MERDMLFREISADNEKLKSKFSPLMSFEFSESDIAKYQNFIKPHVKTNQNANSLTDLIFNQLHPELEGRKLKVTDKEDLKNDWKNIYRQIVLTLLAQKDKLTASPIKSVTSKWLNVFKDATLNNVEFLIDGEETYESLAKTIKTANKKGDFIYILGWMLNIKFELIKNNEDSTLQNLLTRAANNGAEVRVLIWDNPGSDFHSKIKLHVQELQAHPNIKAFVDTATYSTPATRLKIAIITAKLKQLYTLVNVLAIAGGGIPAILLLDQLNTKVNYYLNIGSVGSQHDKVVIVKSESGLSAFCGGIDFNPNRFKDFRDTKTGLLAGYHDVHCKVKDSPAAYKILQKFILRWQNHPQTGRIGLIGNGQKIPADYTDSNSRFAEVVGTYNKADGSEKQRDRTLSDAYFNIIKNSTESIYIEDQYLVNLDVARALNLKIKDGKFKKLFIVIQDPLETGDILYPNKRRKDFKDFLFLNTTEAEKNKVLFFMIDSKKAKTKGYHPGLHSKLLIADDEIAIIGTANVNQRSFTHDSETSVVVFDRDETQPKFAKKLREAIWNDEYTKINLFTLLSLYQDANNDFDQKIMSFVNIAAAGSLSGMGVKIVISSTLKSLSTALWENIIDPKI